MVLKSKDKYFARSKSTFKDLLYKAASPREATFQLQNWGENRNNPNFKKTIHNTNDK